MVSALVGGGGPTIEALRVRAQRASTVPGQFLEIIILEKHPEKTFVGKIKRGFDFLGYHLSPERLTVARETLKRFVSHATRLYEQGPGEPCGSSRLGSYVRRWVGSMGGPIAELALSAPLHAE